jgi:hypothetical protein
LCYIGRLRVCHYCTLLTNSHFFRETIETELGHMCFTLEILDLELAGLLVLIGGDLVVQTFFSALMFDFTWLTQQSQLACYTCEGGRGFMRTVLTIYHFG